MSFTISRNLLKLMSIESVMPLVIERVTDFIFLGSKITADVDCGHELKRHLLLEEKL